jgi:DNA-binding transcriptional LysR family regulator
VMDLPALDPELLKAFVAVADQRSFTRAAARLNRTQSAVSMQIKRLEDRLGVTLFYRTRANVELSPTGEGLIGYARRILSLNDEAVARLREHKVEGIVRLGVMDDYGTSIVPPVLANFLTSYPLIQVQMETGLTSTMPARLGKAYDLIASRSRIRCRSPSIRRAVCSGSGRWKHWTRPNGAGASPLSATAWERWNRSQHKDLPSPW